MYRSAITAFAVLFTLPALASAAVEHHPILDVSPLWAAPFVVLLLGIAILPLIVGHFWHSNLNKALVVAVVSAPVVLYLYLSEDANYFKGLLHALIEYASFIILLASLYTVSGGIVLRGDIRARPLTNTLLLAIGAVLANFIGTTGASMLLIWPVLRINSQRTHIHHVPVFFIFAVSNLGGLLTPLGDPPLFIGFLRGIDFFWTLSLWPQWLVGVGGVLAIFLVWDTIAYMREPKEAIIKDIAEYEPIRIEGLRNLIFLAGIILAVLFQSATVGRPLGMWLGQFFPCPDLTLEKPWGEAAMMAMATLALLFTPERLRQANSFSWGPILEVAILFVGIFICMVPALELLRKHGGELGIVEEPWQFFWFTGALSSFLDNAPTYLTFATLAARKEEISWLVENRPLVLQAISCGAVFMGANTYIGNGPNFMVKAIADEAGLRMPSFFGYMVYSGLILLPLFVVITFLFFV